jgi:hypothetical protein
MQQELFLCTKQLKLTLQAAQTMGTGITLPRQSISGHEYDHSLRFSVVVKNPWSYSSLLHVLMAWRLICHKENFTFLCDILKGDAPTEQSGFNLLLLIIIIFFFFGIY